MVYKLPVEDVRPLSQAFFKLETGKSAPWEEGPWETYFQILHKTSMISNEHTMMTLYHK